MYSWMEEENVRSMVDSYKKLESAFVMLALNSSLSEEDRMKYKDDSEYYHDLLESSMGKLEGILLEKHHG